MASNYISITLLESDGSSRTIELPFDYSFDYLKSAIVRVGYFEIDKYALIIDGKQLNLSEQTNFPFLQRLLTNGRKVHIARITMSGKYLFIDYRCF